MSLAQVGSEARRSGKSKGVSGSGIVKTCYNGVGGLGQ